jgi:hypothetical protein
MKHAQHYMDKTVGGSNVDPPSKTDAWNEHEIGKQQLGLLDPKKTT